ncbi:MAG TPA: copper resistance protein NlpE [Methylobacter sp.]|jgi:uncharacterized lipoprotein NlpE involved in copper resistance
MPTFRQKFKQLPTFVLFIAIFSAYSPVFAETAETMDEDIHHAQNGIDWPGVYNGFTPCDDCKGVKTTLALNKNNTYMLITKYVGKSEREFVEKGKFVWDDKSSTISITPRDNSTTRHYSVEENRLTQLDNDGNRISGKLADRYILRRSDIKDSSKPHSSH